MSFCAWTAADAAALWRFAQDGGHFEVVAIARHLRARLQGDRVPRDCCAGRRRVGLMHEIWHVFLVLPQLLLARGELGPQASQLGLGLVSQHDAYGFGGGICGIHMVRGCSGE